MPFELARSLDILERTPAVVAALIKDTDSSWHAVNEGPGTWTAAEVVSHFIRGEETDWMPRARIILEQGEAGIFTRFDREGRDNPRADWTVDRLLDRFAELRRENVNLLRSWNLTDDQLALRSRHPELGLVTLRELIATWVVHDLDHIAQIARVMAKAYDREVGPWRQYLSVLKERR